MIIEDIADYLAANGIGTVATDIFIGEIPLDVNDAIALVYSPSPEPNKSIPYFVQVIDVWGRFTKAEVGYSRLQSIFDLLHRKANYDTGDFHVYLSYAMGMIQDLDRDSSRRKLFQLSISFIFRELNEEIS